MFKVNMFFKGRTTIKEIMVIKETEKFVFLESGNRVSKISESARWFNTYPEAKKFAINRICNVISKGNDIMSDAAYDLQKINKGITNGT